MLAHRVVVLHHGRIAEQGPTAQVLGAPSDDYTKKLIASLPDSRPGRAGGAARGPAGSTLMTEMTDEGAVDLSADDGAPIEVAVRADDVSLAYPRDEDVAVNGVTFTLEVGVHSRHRR